MLCVARDECDCVKWSHVIPLLCARVCVICVTAAERPFWLLWVCVAAFYVGSWFGGYLV